MDEKLIEPGKVALASLDHLIQYLQLIKSVHRDAIMSSSCSAGLRFLPEFNPVKDDSISTDTWMKEVQVEAFIFNLEIIP